MPQNFAPELHLHDATLISVEFVWQDGVCKLNFQKWSTEQQMVAPFVITFNGVTNLSMPRKEEWGSSISINEAKNINGVFSIEMQSGDVISIAARDCQIAAL